MINYNIVMHELGHIIGYVLANKFSSTFLGEIGEVSLGLDVNCVSPTNRLYHFDSNKEEMQRVIHNTEKVERTIAWFIEVIFGCTLQSLYGKVDFKDCFDTGKTGVTDFMNMAAVRPLSAFKWNFDEIDELQNRLSEILIKSNIQELILPIAEKLLTTVRKSENVQIVINGSELEVLLKDVEAIIPQSLIEDYKSLVDSWSLRFKRRSAS